MSDSTETSFFIRNEFLIRRVHSLLGVVPIGLYMCVHLTTNASLMASPKTFQRLVHQIHSLGPVLPVVEWVAIFLPLLFHAIIGIWIARSGRSNTSQYATVSNKRYYWQRITGYLAFGYIMIHVFHLHGWLHFKFWLDNIAHPLGMAQFSPYNAASSLALALDGVVWPAIYLLGSLSCVYHFANGLWTAGITWGLWVSPTAQARATKICGMVGGLLCVVTLTAWTAALKTDAAEARAQEDKMYKAGVEAGTVYEAEHKRAVALESAE